MKKELRERVYNKYQGHCAYCGDKILYKDMQVDHIFPRQREHFIHKGAKKYPEIYGKIPDCIDEYDNLNPACRICNLWKGAFSIEGFRREIMKQTERANKYSANYRMAKKYGLIVVESTLPVVFYFEKISNLKKLVNERLKILDQYGAGENE